MTRRTNGSRVGRFLRRVLVVVVAVALTLTFFLILPVMQTLSKPPESDNVLAGVDAVQEEPPEPPVKEEPKKEPEPEQQPETKLEQSDTPLANLEQMGQMLNPSLGGSGIGGAGLAAGISSVIDNAASSGGLLESSDLDQKPRPVYQPSPRLTPEIRKLLRQQEGKVYVIFIVNASGSVENPIVQRSSHPALEQPVLEALRQWRFEPGKRGGQPVRSRMRIPMIFPRAST